MIHPDFLHEALTARQWADWEHYAALEPFGPEAEDLRHGILCATVAGPHTKPGHPMPPRDFMLGREARADREPTLAETEKGLDALFFGKAKPG